MATHADHCSWPVSVSQHAVWMPKIGPCTAGSAGMEGEADYQRVPVCKHSMPKPACCACHAPRGVFPGLIHAEPRFKFPGSDQGQTSAR